MRGFAKGFGSLVTRLFNSRLARVTFALVVGMTLLRIYLAAVLGLGDDEAYYWDWTRHLSWSYFDHPAMTAWLISIGTAVFGETPFGVRLPNILCTTASIYFLFSLAREFFSEEVGWLTIIGYLFAPVFVLGALLIVPDSPMSVAWFGFSLFLWRASQRPSLRNWLASGCFLGFGILSKYTIVLVALSGLAFLASSRDVRRSFRGRGFWLAIAIALISTIPIFLWNAQYDWPSFRFHLQDRQTGGGGVNFTRWGQFFASQAMALGPALFVGCVATLIVAFRRFADPRWRFIALLSLPPFLVFTVQALFAEFKPHWPAPAYPLLMIGFAQLFTEGFSFSRAKARQARLATAAAVLLPIVPIGVIFHVGAITPIIPKVARAVAPNAAWDPKFDPTNDLYGWPEVAAEAKRLQDDAVARGEPRPFLSSSRYQLVAQLAFVSGERVYRVIPARDQYSFTQTAEVMAELRGKNSIFVTDFRYERDPRNDRVFSDCEARPPFIVQRGDEAAHGFHIWLCRDFH